MRITRRSLFELTASAAGTAVLAACGKDDAGAGTGLDPTDVRVEVAKAIGINTPVTLNIVAPVAVLLAGQKSRIPFALATDDFTFQPDLDITAHLVADATFDVVAGPLAAPFHGEGLGDHGIYLIEVDVPSPGAYWLAAAATDGSVAAIGALQFSDPATFTVPRVGDAFPRFAHATTADPMGVVALCTQEPPCSMHDDTVNAALDAFRGFVVTIATPEFCQTAICGPVVSIVDGVKADFAGADIDWIHIEVFSDAGNTPVEAVDVLGLPSEPWTFIVGPDGRVVERFEGPMPKDLLRTAVEPLAG